MTRYDRQARLAEVGPEGQARIQAATAEVRGSEGHMIELSYLERAGFRAVSLRPERAPEPFAHADWFAFDTAREVGAGAWRALSKIRRVIGTEKP